jgi:CubicO group peptidase (beta-lactamase class C family)
MLPLLVRAATQPELSPRVRALVEKWVGPGRFPGMVASLGLPGEEPEFIARGTHGFTDFDAMTPDTLFRVYSLTKPVTGMAAMLLIDEGKLRLDQPLTDILPAFSHMQVQRTYDGPVEDTVPALRPITIRQLLTHTAGLGYAIIQKGPIRAAMIKEGIVVGRVSRLSIPGLDRGDSVPSLTLFAERLAKMPLVHQPGTAWEYGLGLDVIGRVIEVVSGKPFDTFLRERIFEPCGMTSTAFQVPAADAHRLATNHAVVAGLLVPIDSGETSIYLDPPAFPFGGAGLVSTPRDYDRFLRMLAQGGRLGRDRIMSEAAVALGTSDLLPPEIETRGTFARGGGFGAGGRVGRGAEAGIFGWSGAAGTVATVDMKRGIRAQIFAQFMPPDALPLLAEYQSALHGDVMALIDQDRA